MGNTVTMVFDAQAASFINQQLKMREALMALGADAEKTGERVVKSGDKMGAVFDSLAGKLGSLAGPAAIAGGALALVNEQLDASKRKSEELMDTTEKLFRSLGGSGQISELSKTAQNVRDIKTDYLDDAGKMDIFSQISARGGAAFSADEKARATAQAIRMRDAGIEDVGGAGSTMLQLLKQQRAGGQFAGMSDAQLGSLGYKVNQYLPGGIEGRGAKFFEEAPDKMQALNVLMTGAKSSENAKGMQALLELTEQSVTAREIKEAGHHKASAELKAKVALAAVPKANRLEALMSNPDLYAPPERRFMIRNFARDYSRSEAGDAINEDVLGRAPFEIQEQERQDPALKASRGLIRDRIAGKRLSAPSAGDINFQAHNQQLANRGQQITGLDSASTVGGTINRVLGGYASADKTHLQMIEYENNLRSDSLMNAPREMQDKIIQAEKTPEIFKQLLEELKRNTQATRQQGRTTELTSHTMADQ